MRIFQAESETEMEKTRVIFREYEAWLGFDLCFQGFEEELKNLPGKYSPPEGRIILADHKNELAGCVALRKLEDSVCEMKRLFVRENARGIGLGNILIEKLVAEARFIGYAKMRLDTYPLKMAKAVNLYESHGFYSIPPYYANPYDGVLFMEKIL